MTDIVEKYYAALGHFAESTGKFWWESGHWVAEPPTDMVVEKALAAKDDEIEALRAEVEFLKRDAEHSRKHREEILAANARMREALERAKGVFAYYARLHLDKGTEEGDSKALTNMNHAKEIDKALKGDTNGNT